MFTFTIWIDENGYYSTEDKAYAMKKDREGVMKIYPELKTEDCYVAPIIIMPKSKVYTE